MKIPCEVGISREPGWIFEIRRMGAESDDAVYYAVGIMMHDGTIRTRAIEAVHICDGPIRIVDHSPISVKLEGQ